MDVRIEVEAKGLERAILGLSSVVSLDRHELMDGLGRLIQLQTRNRIEVEKTAPDGEAWKPNRAGTSILYASHALATSIDYRSSQTDVRIGSPLPYAAIHHFGGVIKAKNGKALRFFVGANRQAVFVKSVVMPPRPYLGLSADNVAEAEDALLDFVSRRLQP